MWQPDVQAHTYAAVWRVQGGDMSEQVDPAPSTLVSPGLNLERDGPETSPLAKIARPNEPD